jgi:GT2 family glycosyltransferase
MNKLREAWDVDVLGDLDDDGLLIDTDVFTRLADLYATDPRLGIISFRIADGTGLTRRRHVPRLRAGDPMRRGLVTTFLGGGHGLSMRMLDEIGGWPDAFFFTHEETDLAWRALDADWEILYELELVLQHLRTSPARHAVYYRMTARNRVWTPTALSRPSRACLSRDVDPADSRPNVLARRPAGLVRRFRRGSTDSVR